MDMAPGRDDLALVFFEIDVEVIEHMVFYVDGDGPQFVEFRQSGAGFGALGDEPCLDVTKRALKLRIIQRARRVFFEVQRGGLHCCSRKALGKISPLRRTWK